jgi:N-terminal 7TM region of histidine kinase
MTISGVPLTAPFLIVAVLLLSFAAYSWRQGQVPGARALGWLALAVGIWLFTAALERNAVVLSEKLFWLKVQSFGIVITPAAWLVHPQAHYAPAGAASAHAAPRVDESRSRPDLGAD